jgi:lipoprotein NlpD
MSWSLCLFLLTVALAGCSSTSLNRAPVEDRGATPPKPPAPAVVTEPKITPVKPPAVIDNSGKAGYYTVKPGDTLIRIGLDSGQSHKDIARWNSLDNPNKIEVGQVLRVLPPVAADAGVVTKPVLTALATPAPIPAIGASAPAKAASASVTSPPPSPKVATGDDDLPWIWPGNGQVLTGFDEVKNKGLDISGAAGDPVVAAADGRVVYAGAGLRGYGNLIILKHNATYLSAYAHNQALMVKEDQAVKKGQKIAEMGNSDADRVKLHFEVRREGKPVDPAKFLPPR